MKFAVFILFVFVIYSLASNIGGSPASKDTPAPTAAAAEDGSAEDETKVRKHISYGDNVTSTSASIGCAELDDLASIKEAIVLQKDRISAMKIAINKKCIEKKEKAKGMVQDTSFMHNALCIHFHGEPGCLWMAREAFE